MTTRNFTSFLLLLLLLPFSGSGQDRVLAPVQWTFEAARLNDRTYEVRMTAALAPGWAIYSPSTPSGGPFPTRVSFHPNPMVLSWGKMREAGKQHEKFDRTFGTAVRFFLDKVALVQRVTLRQPVTTVLSGTVEYMACDATRCLPPQTVAFTLPLPQHD